MNENPSGSGVREGPIIESVKLYGERNTGTTFLHNLIRRNFVTTLLTGGVNSEERAQRIALVEHLDEWLIKMIVKDRYESLVHGRQIVEGFGWKHTSPPVAYLASVPERTAKTLFVVLVKHPVYWAQSFQKRPYHSYFRYQQMSFGDFLRHPFVPTGRDNVDAAVYDSVVELYGAKVDGYRRLAELGLPFELVRYEDLLNGIPEFLKGIETKFGLTRRKEKDVILQESTKRDDATLADYQAKYRLDAVKQSVPPEDYDYVIAKFGKDRLAWLGYADC